MNPFFANPPGVMFLFPFSLSLYSSRYCAVLPWRLNRCYETIFELYTLKFGRLSLMKFSEPCLKRANLG